MKQRRRGQAMVEYMLAVLLCLAVSGLISTQMKKGISKIWKSMAKDIAPPCPGCTPPDELN
ncbi:MAG: hypothetical protein HY074_01295 [Deltaproteobacteria bacterium]|nr:hypothetical protein [Deltaproteobacteria bacterium]